MKRVLNLYAGLGGNRSKWGDEYEVTAVEYDPSIAAIYADLYPNDTVIVGDALEYLVNHYHEFDFIWVFQVFIHLTDEILMETLSNISHLLKNEGTCYATVNTRSTEGRWREYPFVKRDLSFYEQAADKYNLTATPLETDMNEEFVKITRNSASER